MDIDACMQEPPCKVYTVPASRQLEQVLSPGSHTCRGWYAVSLASTLCLLSDCQTRGRVKQQHSRMHWPWLVLEGSTEAAAHLEDVVLVDDREVDERLRVQALDAPQDGQQVGQQREEDLQHQACTAVAAGSSILSLTPPGYASWLIVAALQQRPAAGYKAPGAPLHWMTCCIIPPLMRASCMGEAHVAWREVSQPCCNAAYPGQEPGACLQQRGKPRVQNSKSQGLHQCMCAEACR